VMGGSETTACWVDWPANLRCSTEDGARPLRRKKMPTSVGPCLQNGVKYHSVYQHDLRWCCQRQPFPAPVRVPFRPGRASSLLWAPVSYSTQFI
jgi:hypothetical protein